VSGEADADTCTLNVDGEILSQNIADKSRQIKMKPGGGIAWMEVNDEERMKSSLNNIQLSKVAATISRISSVFNYYPDIEFAFLKEELFLLQVRPVTSVKRLPDPNGKKIVWDNSNIIESYPG